jgi:uncharacterized protein
MIIDIHVHPLFLEMFERTPPPPEASPTSQVLDIISDPSSVAQAIDLTSRNYFGRSPDIYSLVDFKSRMKNAGIDIVALQVAPIKGDPVSQINEQVADLLNKFPDSFIGFAGFDPNAGEQAVADIEYAVKELGFRGIKAVSALLGLDINDRAFYPCYDKAQELGVPIMMHTGTGLMMGSRVKHVHPLMVDDVAFDFPNLKIICAHLGGWDYMDVHSMLVRHPNVYADLSFWPLNPHYINLVPWELLEETVPDKILFGSDYPAGQTPQEALKAVKSLSISEEFRQKVMGDNAVKLLGL